MKRIFWILILAVICSTNLIADLNEGLVAYYPFNGNANDCSVNEHNGTNNGATATTDRFGNTDSAMEFNGSNNYIALGDWFIYQNFTISLWINQDQINDIYVDIIDNNHTDYRNWAVQYDSYSANYTFFTQPQGGIQFNLSNSEWKHLVFIKDGAFLKIYLNNILVNELTATSSTINYSSQNLSIARWGGGGRYFDGKIDEIRMYNRALTETEIQELYNQGDWPFLAKFSANPRFGSFPLEVNFTDISNNSTAWDWDFQNDGIIDSYEQNPVFSYNETGIYDVKLKATFGAVVDSLIRTNYIVVQELHLVAPQNPIITKNENDIVLNWDAVLNADYYLIYKSDDPYNDFEYFDYTTAVTSYTHTDVITEESKLFYIIIGFDGTIERLNEFLEVNQTKSFKIDFPNK